MIWYFTGSATSAGKNEILINKCRSVLTKVRTGIYHKNKTCSAGKRSRLGFRKRRKAQERGNNYFT